MTYEITNAGVEMKNLRNFGRKVVTTEQTLAHQRVFSNLSADRIYSRSKAKSRRE